MKTKAQIACSAAMLLAVATLGIALSPAHLAGGGKEKCECSIVDTGDAKCFFDGVRCPKSGGKCKCFKPRMGDPLQGNPSKAAAFGEPPASRALLESASR